MAAFAHLLLAYLFGGVTFIPVLLGIVLCHAYFVLPRIDASSKPEVSAFASDALENDEKIKDQLLHRSHEPDVAAGYFAVCREYVPGGVNGKPPERKTPAGETIAMESPSVYQSMYRSIFDRGKTQSPSLETGKVVKKARNVFYIVLRHGHLLLFDNAEQIEVRHVIALNYYDVDVYAGGNTMSEGELWIKRNCIRLTKRKGAPGSTTNSMPFYLFSDNSSEKEDFYHCLLHNQEAMPDSNDNPPSPLLFDTEDMIKLIRQLHVSEESSQTRWLNALIGRLFLALYKTSDVENYVRTKIMRKMSRVPKPAFITSLNLEEIDMGHSAPLFTNFKLKEMTVDGALTIEADVKYSGNFKLVTSAVARLALGSRFKPKEVSLVLAGIFKKVEGHLLIHFKPPPSNRIWLSFETMPKLDISLEPIVSSRQITYGVILRALESRVREVFSDTLVYPNWDDSPFTKTQDQRVRGGIWKEQEVAKPFLDSAEGKTPAIGTQRDTPMPEDEPQIPDTTNEDREKSMSMPDLSESPLSSSKRNKGHRDDSISSKTDEMSSTESQTKHDSLEKPKVLRARSFATVADPVVSKGPSSIDATRRPSSKRNHQDAAVSAMKILSSRSPEPSPRQSPVGSPVNEASPIRRRTSSSAAARGILDVFSEDSTQEGARQTRFRTNSTSDALLVDTESSAPNPDSGIVDSPVSLDSSDKATTTSSSVRSSVRTMPIDRKAVLNQSISSATTAAKNWGWGVINRQHERQRSLGSSNEPVGRGQPLPPPGVPLPRPSVWPSNAFGSLRRKPVPSGGATAAARAATESFPGNSSSSSVATNPEIITSSTYQNDNTSKTDHTTEQELKDETTTSDDTEDKTYDGNADNPQVEQSDEEDEGSMMFAPELDTISAQETEDTINSPMWNNEYVQAS